MKKPHWRKLAITLEEHNKNNTPEENAFIEAEVKYIEMSMALRQRRKELGLTQEKLAHLSNLPRTTITKVESDSRNTTLQTLMKIAQALGSTLELRLLS